MGIVLVYPFRQNLTDLGVPLGLLYLATYLKQSNYDAGIIDMGAETASDDEIAGNILASNPALVGLPLYSIGMKKVYDFTVLLRNKGYNGKIVLGAQQATVWPRETMENFQQVDYLIRYEAEIPLTKLAKYLIDKQGTLDDIENLYYRSTTIKSTADVPDINNNIDILPIPDRLILDKYYRQGRYNRPYVKGDCDSLISSRGCPFRCNFCFPSAFKFRSRSSQSIITELRYLKSMGRKHIEIMDDTFTVNKRHLMETLNSIIEADLKLSLKIRSRVDVIDEPMLKLMKAAGVKMIVYGIESGSDRMLKAMNKRTTVADNSKAIRMTRKAGIACFADVFIGYPGEDKESINDTINFLLESKPIGITSGVYLPFPQTVGYQIARDSGRLVGRWDCRDDKMPYVKLDWMEDASDIWQEVQKLRRRFYCNPAVFLQTSGFMLKNMKFSDLVRVLKFVKALFSPRAAHKKPKDS